MNTSVDNYLIEGCGRCSLGGTPQCKVHHWLEELKSLRIILLDCGLTEEVKWGVPCYTHKHKNVVILSAFKEYIALSFFKGSLLNDTDGLLEKPGENTQAARLIRFTHIKDIMEKESILKDYIYEAIEVENAGLKVDFKEKHSLEYPEELNIKMAENPDFKKAFEALTPGRQRGYIIHFTQPKQSKTREARIEKCMPQIFAGLGWNGR